jgi:NAD(P)-dependent dehydrogenase (short-subunit alcohol dehydrogenase family)
MVDRGESSRRTAVVVGAGGGMGSDLALALGRRGYSVGLLDADEEALAGVQDQLRREEVRCCAVVADVVQQEQVDTAFTTLGKSLGPPWALAVTAGVLSGALLLDSEDSEVRRTIETNLLGVIRVDRAAARLMVSAGRGGRILHWSSTSAYCGSPGYSAYSASKAAVNSLTMTFSAELAGDGITVNGIAPGWIDTGMVGYLDAREVRRAAASTPLGRWGLPADVTGLACFLLSEEAGWISGVTVPVDGGYTATPGPIDLSAVRERISRERDYRRAGRPRPAAVGRLQGDDA